MKCNECNIELEQYIDDDVSCSCHISPPCSKCTDDRMVCPECGEIYKNDYIPSYTGKPYIKPLPKTPIDSGISYITVRSGGWVQVQGTYRKDMTFKQVKEKLGHFDKYHMFRMKQFTGGNFSASWCTN